MCCLLFVVAWCLSFDVFVCCVLFDSLLFVRCSVFVLFVGRRVLFVARFMFVGCRLSYVVYWLLLVVVCLLLVI